MLIAIISSYALFQLFTLQNNNKRPINSFAGIEPFSSEKKLLKKMGKPTKQSVLENHFLYEYIPGKKYIYNKQVYHDEDASMKFITHPFYGLVKTTVKFPFERGYDCKRLFQKFFLDLNQKYKSSLRSRNSYNQLNVQFCNAVLVGKAAKFAQWKDPYGKQITLVLGSKASQRHLKIIFETPQYLSWNSYSLIDRITSLWNFFLRMIFA